MHDWHDYHLTKYVVDGENACIRFQLVWPYATAIEIPRATVTFSGVLGYYFEYDLGVSIVFAFQQRPLMESLEKFARQFAESEIRGWPLFWRGNVEHTRSYLEEQGAQFFEISSSYGLSGWICAKAVAHERSEEVSARRTGIRRAIAKRIG
jgi:hypothetical protein